MNIFALMMQVEKMTKCPALMYTLYLDSAILKYKTPVF